jgi:tRNA(Ile)-lysidine synthase
VALARSARHAAQAQTLLDALADLDLERVGCPPRIVDLQALAPERQVNVVRRWLKRGWGAAPSEAQLRELLDQVDVCRTRGHRIAIKIAGGHVTRDREWLAYAPPI